MKEIDVPFYMRVLHAAVAPFLYAECALLIASLYRSTGHMWHGVLFGVVPATMFFIAFYRCAPRLVHRALRHQLVDAKKLIATYIFYMEGRVPTTRSARIQAQCAFLQAAMDYAPSVIKKVRVLTIVQFLTFAVACFATPYFVDSLPVTTALIMVGAVSSLTLIGGLYIAKYMYDVHALLTMEKMVQKDLRLC